MDAWGGRKAGPGEAGGRESSPAPAPNVWEGQEWNELTQKLWQAALHTRKDVPSKIRDPTARKMVEIYHDQNMGRMAERMIMRQGAMWPMMLWWIISLWIRVVEIFGSNMTMAFIGRINTDKGNDMLRKYLSVRKDLARIKYNINTTRHEIERLFRTRIGNRPRYRYGMYKVAMFTGMLWMVGRQSPMNHTAATIVMAWVTRDKWMTALAMAAGTQALDPFDWTEFNRLLQTTADTPAEAAITWTMIATMTTASAIVASRVLTAIVRLIRAQTTALTGPQWANTRNRMAEAEVQFASLVVLAESMKTHITRLEAEMANNPSVTQISDWKQAVMDLEKANAVQEDMRKEIDRLKDELAKAPTGNATKRERKLIESITDLQTRLNESNTRLTEALTRITAPSEGGKPSRSVIKDPTAFDGTKPEEFPVWKAAVTGKIQGDGSFYFHNQVTVWEYLCGTVKGKVAIHMRQHKWEEFIQDDDVVMGNAEDLRTSQVINGFIRTVYQNFGNPVLYLTLNDRYQQCTQGNRTFQEYYQELSLLAKQLGFSTTDNTFKGILEYRTANYLKMLVVNKTYKTVEEAVEDLRYTVGRYRLLNKPSGKKANENSAEEPTNEQLRKEIEHLKKAAVEKPEKEARKFKKRSRPTREPGSIKEPCPRGDDCKHKESGTCYRQH